MTKKQMMQALQLKDREYFRKDFLQPALANGLLEMKFPDRPKHPGQKYRLTEQGKKLAIKLTRDE